MKNLRPQSELEGSLTSYQKKANQLQNDFNLSKRQVKTERKELKLTKQLVKDSVEAQQILQEIAKQIQESAHVKISAIVSKALEIVYEKEAYQFSFEFHKKRGRTEAVPVFTRNNRTISNPLGAASGGQGQLAGLVLRIAYIVLSRPPKRRIIFCDEPVLGIDRERIGRVRMMFEHLSKELSMQFVIVTHNRYLACGQIVRL